MATVCVQPGMTFINKAHLESSSFRLVYIIAIHHFIILYIATTEKEMTRD